jgi:class 3 adenylate cyclase/CHASE3 domain sensor protein
MTEVRQTPDKPRQRLEWVGQIQPFKYLWDLRRRMKIGPKLRIGFGVLILLMLVGYGSGIVAGNQATEKINRTTNLRAPLALASGQAQANWLKMEADVQAYLALGDETYRLNYEIARKDFEGNIRQLEAILEQSRDLESPEYRELSRTLSEIRLRYNTWRELVPELFDLRDDQLRREPALHILIVDAAPYMNTLIVETTALITTQKQQALTAQNLKVMSAMYDFRSSLYAMIAGLRGYVATARPPFKYEYQVNEAENTQALNTIQSSQDLLTPSQIEGLGRIESAREAFLLLPGRMFEAVEGPNARTDLFLFRATAVPLSDGMLDLLDKQANFQQALLQSELNTGREQLARAQVITIVSAGIVILAGLLVAFAIANDIARPILRLTEVAETIKSGNLTARSEVSSQDEIGILAGTFNSMTASLQYTLDSLRLEQEKSENLLLNILPKDIVELLKKKPDSIAEQYSEASILFADVVNFTPMSSQMTPIELVELLNQVFSQFDGLVEKYDLEKIKTIGDCYMVASGVPRPRQDHAKVITCLALDMQEIVRKSDYFGRKLTFRIGINSGPVVAGVIGRKKFIYDLWGDAVNTASRMESNGTGGLVQITKETYNLINEDFVCESRGVINVKGKGELPVWFVRGRKQPE